MTDAQTRVVSVEATEKMIEAGVVALSGYIQFSGPIVPRWRERVMGIINAALRAAPAVVEGEQFRTDVAMSALGRIQVIVEDAFNAVNSSLPQPAAPAAPVQGEGEAVAWRYPVLSARDEAIAAMARAMRNGQGWPAVFAPGAAEKLAEDALSALEADAILAKGEGHE